MDKKIIIFLLLSIFVMNGSSRGPRWNYKVYGNVANFFENKSDFLNFFDFHKGDVIAEVGTGYGENIGGFSLLADSLDLWAQDIDTSLLNKARFSKVIKYCEKYKKPLNCSFHLCIGTEKCTNLPDSTFDKIILVSAFHEFGYIDEMMTDIYRKLNAGGKLYILEAHCYTKGHKNYSFEETVEMLKRNHFKLVKKDGKNLHRSSDLVRMIFVKN